MPDKAPTYRIDEDRLRQKLLDYQVDVNPARCEAIEQEVANIRFKKTISLPKINLRIVIPAALILGVTALVIFNLDSIKDLFAPAPEIKKTEYKAPVQVNKPEEKPSMPATLPGTAAVPTVETPTVVNTPPPARNNPAVSKPDTNTGISKKNDSSSRDNAKKPNPVLAEPPSDSSIKKNDTIKEDTTSTQKSEAPVKKKKKRRRRNANMEELKQSTLQQGGGDDDVVVPQ